MPSVRVKRATAPLRSTSPSTGILSMSPSILQLARLGRVVALERDDGADDAADAAPTSSVRRKSDSRARSCVGSGSSPPKSVNILANVGMMKMSMNAVAPSATVSTTAG